MIRTLGLYWSDKLDLEDTKIEKQHEEEILGRVIIITKPNKNGSTVFRSVQEFKVISVYARIVLDVC